MTDTLPHLIALTGYAGTGKDAVAKILVEEHGYTKLAFADEVKKLASKLYRLGEADPVKWWDTYKNREVASTLGNAVQVRIFRDLLTRVDRAMREVDPDFWVNMLESILTANETNERPYKRFVISDCRFPNEAKWIDEWDSCLWRINREGYGPQGSADQAIDTIETPLDASIDNDGTLEDLSDSVQGLLYPGGRSAAIPEPIPAMPELLYIAAPFGAETIAEIRDNVERVTELHRFALAQGWRPIAVHPTVFMGGFGEDTFLSDRERGLQVDCDLACMVARQGGTLWVILRDDGSMSEGTTREADAFREVGKGREQYLTWRLWQQVMQSNPDDLKSFRP